MPIIEKPARPSRDNMANAGQKGKGKKHKKHTVRSWEFRASQKHYSNTPNSEL